MDSDAVRAGVSVIVYPSLVITACVASHPAVGALGTAVTFASSLVVCAALFFVARRRCDEPTLDP